MTSGRRQSRARHNQHIGAEFSLNPQWCTTQATWRQRRRFQDLARTLIELPAPGDPPLDHLLSETVWNRLVPKDDHEEAVLTALSHATGVYFFPSLEWVRAFCRFLHLLRVRRVLEAGAGRGYLASALAPLLARQGIAFKAVDDAQGEFESGLPRHPVVEPTDALTAAQAFHPELVVYAWPPPGQSLAPLCRTPGVRYVLVQGESNGGCTGDPADWVRLRYRSSELLSRFGLARSGRRRQAVTIFFGAASHYFQESPVSVPEKGDNR
jgi:hypothetical protein